MAAFCATLATTVHLAGQTTSSLPKEVAGIPVNYDEALVGDYRLPDPLQMADGKTVRNAKTWYQKRRPEIVRLFEENQFGRSPEAPSHISYDAFNATRRPLTAKPFEGKQPSISQITNPVLRWICLFTFLQKRMGHRHCC